MSDDTYPLTQENIERSPLQQGVYALYDQNEIIYIGRAKGEGVTIRSRLSDHHSGQEGYCTQNATHYWREVCSNPSEREVELLESYQNKHGCLPRCNERIG